MPAKSSKSFVVYAVGSTMEESKVYKSKYAADQLASKLQSEAARKGMSAERSMGWLQAEKVLVEKAGDPHGAAPKIDKLIAMLKAGQQYAVAEQSDFHENVVYQSLKVNLMSKKEYWEPSNTPGYCSPSREAYWSM